MVVNVDKTTITNIQMEHVHSDKTIIYKDKTSIIVNITDIEEQKLNDVINIINKLFDIQRGGFFINGTY